MSGFNHTVGGPRKGLSRRVVIHAAWLLAGGAAAAPTVATATAKVSQKEASYQASPNGNARCANCRQFQAPASCTLVDGAINPTGWCTFFAARPRN
jgi:hypothetical protein